MKKPPAFAEGFQGQVMMLVRLFQLAFAFSGHHVHIRPKAVRVHFAGGETIGFGPEFAFALFVHGLFVRGDLGIGTAAYAGSYRCFGGYTLTGALFSARGR
jgi:hypothetical protein